MSYRYQNDRPTEKRDTCDVESLYAQPGLDDPSLWCFGWSGGQTFVNAASAKRLMAAMQDWLDNLPKPGVLDLTDDSDDVLHLRSQYSRDRLGVGSNGGGLVMLTPDQAREARDSINAWLETQ